MIVLQILGWILLGGIVVVGGVVGLCILIAKSTAHDINKCECVDCQRRRERRFEKRQKKLDQGGVDPTVGKNPGDYWSTQQLRTGYHVIVRDTVYEVGLIRTMPDGSAMVHLRNVTTNREVQPVMITLSMKPVKIWRKGMDPGLYR